jgi:hypothetical protein
MSKVRILILGGTIWQIVLLEVRSAWAELFGVDNSRFRKLQGGSKIQSFGKMVIKVRCRFIY